MLAENLAGVCIDLAERHRAEPARALQAKVEPADPGEQRQNLVWPTPPHGQRNQRAAQISGV